MFYITVTTAIGEVRYISVDNNKVWLTTELDDACMFATYQLALWTLRHLADTGSLDSSIKYCEICTRHVLHDEYRVVFKPGTKCRKLYVVSVEGNNLCTSTVPGKPLSKDAAELLAARVRDLTLANVFLEKA